MANIRIKRRLTGSAGAPVLLSGELAVNFVDQTLYAGNGTTAVAIGGSGAFVDRSSAQSISGVKTFSDGINAGSNVIAAVATPVQSTDAANKGYVDSAISSLVDGAQDALDTLRELGAALGDDANFASTITNRFSAVSAAISGLEADIASNDSAISTLQSQVSTLESEMDAVEGRATSLEEANSARIAAISGLDSRLSSAESDIDSLQSDLSTAESNIASLQSDLDAAEGDIDSLESRMTEAESDITALEGRATDLESDVADHETRIAALEAEIDGGTF